MGRLEKGLFRNLALAVVVALTVLLGPGAGLVARGEVAPVASAPGLFAETATRGAVDASGDPTVLRARFVEVDLGLLLGAQGPAGEMEQASRLTLNFFEDVAIQAVLDRAGTSSGGSWVWRGHVEGEPLSQVTLVVRDGVLAGNVVIPAVGFYQVRYAGNGVHAVYEIDQSAFPDEMEPIPVEVPGAAEAPADPNAPADDGSVIDVMVSYTGAAKTAAGGTASMLALIDLAVEETNQSYANSLITQRLNLVHTVEVSYVESGNISTDLSRFQYQGDGYMDNVHALRDTYKADEMALIVANGGGYCGVAYMMTTVSTTFENAAFAVVALSCATGYYSFGHELGHNMGARHDWYVDQDTTPYPHNHGYVNTADQWRTIMAYNTDCDDLGFNCTRLQYWSNPDVSYGGDPMGVPEGTSTSCLEGVHNPNCDADNRKTLNKTAWTVANFRVGGSLLPAAPTNLSATAVSQSQINLAWTDNSSNETGFKIERSPNGSSSWGEIGQVGANVTTYPNTGLSAGTTYYYRVRAYNTSGDSAYSNVAWATTQAVVVGPLEVAGYLVDDDTNGDSDGNGNHIANCGERIELFVDLHNAGSDPASTVAATISTSDPYVTWLFNLSSSYGDIDGGATATNGDDFDFALSAGAPHGHTIHFNLNISAASGGPWSDSFDLPVSCLGANGKRIYVPLVLHNQPITGFDSQFNGSAPGWETHAGTWWFDSGDWYTTEGLLGQWASISYDADFTNLDYQAALWRTGCEDCASGLMVRGAPEPLGSGNRWNSGYGFYITRNGRYAVFHYAGGVASTLKAWEDSFAIHQGSAWNTLRVVAYGDSLYFYVNGTLVWAGIDASYPVGRVGIIMYRDLLSSFNQLWVDWAHLQPATSVSGDGLPLLDGASGEPASEDVDDTSSGR